MTITGRLWAIRHFPQVPLNPFCTVFSLQPHLQVSLTIEVLAPGVSHISVLAEPVRSSLKGVLVVGADFEREASAIAALLGSVTHQGTAIPLSAGEEAVRRREFEVDMAYATAYDWSRRLQHEACSFSS